MADSSERVNEEVMTNLVSSNASNPDEVSESSIQINNGGVSFSQTGNSNEILLYVDENNQNVQDLIQVALNQAASQEGQPCIALQSIDNAQNIIPLNTETNQMHGHLVASPVIINVNETEVEDVNVNEAEETVVTTTACNNSLNNLFQLANLSGSLPEKVLMPNNEKDIATIVVENVEYQNQSTAAIIKIEETESKNLHQDVLVDQANMETASSNEVPFVESCSGKFNVGDAFYSLEEIEDTLRLYEESHSVKLYKRDVRSLEALLKRSLKLQKLDEINEKLKYGQLLYCCVYGGKRKAQKMACIDESGLARYTDCKMFIRLSISDDGMKLVVNGKNEVHCHEEVISDQENLEPLYVTNTGNAEELKLGAGFIELDALYNAVHKYETDNHIHLWRRDGRTVEALARRAPGTAKKIMETNPGLRFAELRFCCSYGGRQLSEEKKEKIKSQHLYRQGCEMHIRFGISEDGSQLVVKSMSEEHNHEIDEETVVKEALHPDLCSYVSKLVWGDINITIDEVKRLLEVHVVNEMFKDQPSPPRTRRQYYPSKKQIRYFMSKAKSALNISSSEELKLEAHAEKLKAIHSNDKMIFNFRVEHNLFTQHDVTDDDQYIVDTAEPCPESLSHEQSAHLLFCHQTPYQQRLLKRYGSQVILTHVKDIHSKIPFPLYCLYVQTNVDYQLVGEFITQITDESMIAEGLATFKEWNPGWTPKFFVVDYSEYQIAAVEQTFLGCFVLISDLSREKSWNEWVSSESSRLASHKDVIMSSLQAIATSYSEDTLNAAARELEESEVWKMSDKLRNWFQVKWLAQAKRWVAGYRPDDYLMTQHNDRTINDELKLFKSVKLINKASPLHDVIQYIVEHIVPHSKRQYEVLNEESCKFQNELFYTSSNIPPYLSSHPGKLTKHVYDRILLANSLQFTIAYVHPGIFTVQGNVLDDDVVHTVSFGDYNSFPSCDCCDWQRFKIPCVHFCCIFNTYADWSWDMLCVPYRSNPLLNVDWSILTQESDCVPGYKLDRSTQTMNAGLVSSDTTSLDNNLKIPDFRRTSDSPQVLATQCRTLLQQLVKVQLGHQNRESLCRIKSDLKELVSICATSKPLQSSQNSLQGKYPFKKAKMNIPLTDSTLTVFQQYNIQPVTPKQTIDSSGRKLYTMTRSRLPDPESSDVNNGEIISDDVENECCSDSTSNPIQICRKRKSSTLFFVDESDNGKLTEKESEFGELDTSSDLFVAIASTDDQVSSSSNVIVQGTSPIPIVLLDGDATDNVQLKNDLLSSSL